MSTQGKSLTRAAIQPSTRRSRCPMGPSVAPPCHPGQAPDSARRWKCGTVTQADTWVRASRKLSPTPTARYVRPCSGFRSRTNRASTRRCWMQTGPQTKGNMALTQSSGFRWQRSGRPRLVPASRYTGGWPSLTVHPSQLNYQRRCSICLTAVHTQLVRRTSRSLW